MARVHVQAVSTLVNGEKQCPMGLCFIYDQGQYPDHAGLTARVGSQCISIRVIYILVTLKTNRVR